MKESKGEVEEGRKRGCVDGTGQNTTKENIIEQNDGRNEE